MLIFIFNVDMIDMVLASICDMLLVKY